jgi:hypothetical protein
MLDKLGFPSGSTARDRGESIGPTQREWRERDAARVDQQLFDRAADWLRDDPKRRRVAGLCADRVGHAPLDLLDALGDDAAGLDEAVRWQARESCRVLLGEQVASATTRRR